MHQSALTGFPQPQATPKGRGGRPKLPAKERVAGSVEVGVYREDEDYLDFLVKTGYATTRSGAMRKAMREVAESRGGKRSDGGDRLPI